MQFKPSASDATGQSPRLAPTAILRDVSRHAAQSQPASQDDVWSQEACANEPAGFFNCGEQRSLFYLGARVLLAAVLFVSVAVSRAAVREVGPIGMTVADIERSVDFYSRVLAFETVSDEESHGEAVEKLYGVFGSRVRSVTMRLGEESIVLTEFLTPKGRPIPADSRSYDRWFQHIAVVVADMDKAYAHLRAHRVRHVSTGPQTLPEWNKAAGGIRAFYFRDPDDHVLEVISFPRDKGDPKWQMPTDRLFLGIDHTAIVVGDTEKSLAFYRDHLGLRVVGGSENHGPEQERLNQVFGARLRITALRAENGPGIEFLEYITPADGRPLWPDAASNDLVFWRTMLRGDGVADSARRGGASLVSSGVGSQNLTGAGDSGRVILRDPDGHALHIEESSQ